MAIVTGLFEVWCDKCGASGGIHCESEMTAVMSRLESEGWVFPEESDMAYCPDLGCEDHNEED